MTAKVDFSHDGVGWYAFVSDDDLVIGYNYEEHTSEVYRGNFKGVDTPHIF